MEVLDLYDKVGPHYYQRIDLHLPEGGQELVASRLTQARLSQVAGTEIAVFDASDGFRFSLADGSWLQLRFSGTEPIFRIYAEANSLERVGSLLEFGRGLVGA